MGMVVDVSRGVSGPPVSRGGIRFGVAAVLGLVLAVWADITDFGSIPARIYRP
mgnify:CR=1 FL=1